MSEPTKTAPTIDDFINQKINRGANARVTAPRYKKFLKQFEASLNRGNASYRPISDATKSDVEQFVAHLLKSNSPTTVRTSTAPLREYFKRLWQDGFRPDNPTSELGPAPKATQKSKAPFVLTRSQMNALLEAPRGLYGLRDKAIIQLLYSGLKRAEISAASIHHFEPEKRRLKVADRIVPLKKDAADAISAYLLVRPKVKNTALILSNRKEALGLRQVWQNAKKYVLKCGLNDKTSLETIRDTFVVHALDDGIDIKDIRAARGKSDGPWLRDLISLTRPSANKISIDDTAASDVTLTGLLHPKVSKACLHHFIDGDYREAVLNAMLMLTETIREKSGVDGDGVPLVSKVFKPEGPVLAFTKRATTSERDEQAGFHKLMLGAFEGVRNPRSHSFISDLTSRSAAQYLAFISLLIQRVEDAEKLG